MATIYVTVWYPNPEDPGDPFPAAGINVHIVDAQTGTTIYTFVTDDLGRVFPPFDLPDIGTFTVYAAGNGYESPATTVTDGYPTTISLYLAPVAPSLGLAWLLLAALGLAGGVYLAYRYL